jgi:GNAT superfamily N-acetyltransferase
MTSVSAIAYPFADRALSQRFERAEGTANRAFVDARRLAEPQVGAAWIERDGVLAMFDGVASPVSQSFGLGLLAPPTDEQVTAIERFFGDRGALANHETSPLADSSLGLILAARGYRPIEYSNVMYRPTALPLAEPNPSIVVNRVAPTDALRWARTAAEGWGSEGATIGEFVLGFGRTQIAAGGFHALLATHAGRDIAAGGLFVDAGIALLAGASTIPSARRLGAQFALLHARLQMARAAGCDLAMIVALPGSASQRNAERHGFRIAYTRTKWQGPGPGTGPGTGSGTGPGTGP